MQQMQVFKSLRNPMNSISKNLVIVIHSHSHMYLVIQSYIQSFIYFLLSFQELLLHKDDFPGLQPGDIVEIYHPENELLNDKGEIKVPRLMLMISKASIYPDNELQKPLNRETVNLEKSVAETFQLPNYRLTIFRKSVVFVHHFIKYSRSSHNANSTSTKF